MAGPETSDPTAQGATPSRTPSDRATPWRTPVTIAGEATETTREAHAADMADKMASTISDNAAARPDQTPVDEPPEPAAIATEALITPDTPPKADALPSHRPSRLAYVAAGLAAVSLLIGLWLAFAAYNQTDSDTAGAQASLDALSGRVEALDKRLQAIEARPTPLSGSAAVASAPDSGLVARVAALEASAKAAPAATPDATPAASSASASDDVAGALRDAAAAKTAAETAQATAQAAKQAADAAAARPLPAAVDLGPLDARIGRLEGRLTPLEATLSAPKNQSRATEARAEAGPAPADVASLAVVADVLGRAVERGAPFATELAAASSLGADPAQLAKLRPLAPAGVKSARALAAAFAPLAGKLAGTTADDAPTDVWDRLKREATSLVRVRPTAEAAGPSPGAVVSRIEAALNRDDAAAALSEWQTLPMAAKAQSAAWGADLTQRVEAQKAAAAILADVVARLGRTPT